MIHIDLTHHTVSKKFVAVVLKDSSHHFSVVIDTANRAEDEAYEMALQMISRGGVDGSFLEQEFPVTESKT